MPHKKAGKLIVAVDEKQTAKIEAIAKQGEINGEGIPVLLVEQNASKALALAHRAYVLETGVVAKEGTGKELLESEDVQKAYLGM